MDVSEDVVYVENGAERYEYVMNERGRLFYGRASKISSRPWYFGQVGSWIKPELHYKNSSEWLRSQMVTSSLITINEPALPQPQDC